MNCCETTPSHIADRPPIAILGVPFDNVTKAEAIELVERMIVSGKPHYMVTPNVDFLAQARNDVELRRILFEAHLVLCDGTPLVWASRMLGNALPERVAGSDLVPLLIQTAAKKKYRLFLLGATEESAQRAVARLEKNYPGLIIAGYYSPPFNTLLEMDHDEIKRRIVAAKPDLLLVSFGCPKQEKWVAMHYRSLGVPVTAGVGATIDFLAGQLRRAPVWMQRSGTEWMFRLVQEPRRLFRRYVTDLWVFGSSILPQWWELQARPSRKARRVSGLVPASLSPASNASWSRVRLPDRLDYAAVAKREALVTGNNWHDRDCLLDLESTRFIDSTGVGFLIRLHKRMHARGHVLVLMQPSAAVLRAFQLMKLTEFFHIVQSESAAVALLEELQQEPLLSAGLTQVTPTSLHWRGEITAANADSVWGCTKKYLNVISANHKKTIDLSDVRFIDSTGLGLMVRAKKLSFEAEVDLEFVGLRPSVRNVLRVARLEGFLLGTRRAGEVLHH